MHAGWAPTAANWRRGREGIRGGRKARSPARWRGFSTMFGGAQGRNRTADTGIFNPLLYQLSYLGKSGIGHLKEVVPRDGIEPPTRGFSIPCSTN
ncbi:hypothetical protein OF001_U160043 [Pseudomonas sp. OF001]|nr:hypothetical protein OF001_U160043 [Pseudomonas sp. OF001]